METRSTAVSPRFARLCSAPLGMKIGSPTFHATVLPAISTLKSIHFTCS
jgi:hypothetical protein